MRHFEIGSYKNSSSFLSDEVYGTLLDNIVKGCADILMLTPDGKSVILGKRRIHPQPDYWFAGGRMKTAESPQQSARRLLKREFNLDVPLDRFDYVTCNSMVWDRREQEPKDHGCCDVNVVFSLVLEQHELDSLQFDPVEYSATKQVELLEISSNSQAHYSPVLCRCVRMLLAGRLMECVKELLADPDSAAQVVELMKQYVELTEHVPAEAFSYELKDDMLASYSARVTMQ